MLDHPIRAHLGEIAHTPQQAQRNTRGPACPPGDLGDPVLVRLHFQHLRGAFDDHPHSRLVVIIQAIHRAESRPQRRGDQGQPGGGADNGKAWQFETQGAGCRAFADDNVEGVILHGRVEHFFHGSAQAVDLINEEDVVGP